jgi:hypothetical protein
MADLRDLRAWLETKLMYFRGRGNRQALRSLQTSGDEPGMFTPGRQHPQLTIHVGGSYIVDGRAQASSWLEDGKLHRAGGVFKEPHAVIGFVRTRDDEVHVSVVISIDRNRPGPEANAQVNHQPGMVVADALQPLKILRPKKRCEHQQPGRDGCHPPSSSKHQGRIKPRSDG